MRRGLLSGLTLTMLLAATSALAQSAQAQSAPGEKQPAAEKPAEAAQPPLNEAEKKFQQTLSGAALVGYFTDSNNRHAAPKEERYTIHQVSKIGGNLWLFQARIQYGERDLTLPLPLRVEWAGKTPVITLDNLPVPPLGSFSARVVIHEGKYAGTWSGGDHGGHLFGRVEPQQPSKPEKEATP